jgi:hypothetical protein
MRDDGFVDDMSLRAEQIAAGDNPDRFERG